MTAAQPFEPVQVETLNGEASAPATRARVLVVDDDERNVLAIRTVIEDLAEVETASSGEEALRHLLKGEFAVILLDVFMPGMDGYETAQIIRQREQTKRIPIVFLSAVNKEKEHLMRGYALGAVDYVFKPVEPVVLRSKVAVFVDLYEMTQEVQRKAEQEQRLLDENLRANAERLRAEKELRRAEQRQAAIIQSLPIILYLEPLDCDPRCPHFVSGDLAAITGFTFDQVRENPSLWQERLHEEDREQALAAFAARRKTGRFSVEYRWQCADGSYRHFHDQAVLLKDSKDRPLEFAGTLTDITERRALQTQLIQAQKMDAIGKLTGGIAHDFNNLLAAVLGGLGLIERRADLGEEERRILAMTKRAADQGSELIGRLLAFARRQQLKPACIEVQSLAKAVTELLAPMLGGMVTLEWKFDEEPWCAFADQSQLELALINLIINARDSLKRGGNIVISVENRSIGADDPDELEPGDYLVLAVVDKGCGIAPDHMEKVMEPFFTTKDVGKGTGLGLSMVYGFAKQSDGAFRLQSELGKGTRAEIWLPRATATATEAADGWEAVEAAPAPTSSRRILLVDDHEEVRGTTAALLQELGHSVTEAANGAEAIEALKKIGSCDLLISDYAMPELSGTDLLRELRKVQRKLPCIIITGYAEGEAVEGRPDDVMVLSKPFTPAKLSDAILKAF
ncbi:response regulator [Sphingomonas sp.]|uniref:response regulator n=1 Tax=Sphingomonas sp. TaxID=28214 RepID=UPI0017DAF1F5|nr:response regulator [Sphingomonas sp.]MBA3511967.1 response regulator [Sphingomonas sp.]